MDAEREDIVHDDCDHPDCVTLQAKAFLERQQRGQRVARTSFNVDEWLHGRA